MPSIPHVSPAAQRVESGVMPSIAKQLV